MTGDFISDFSVVMKSLLQLYKYYGFLIGLVSGFFLVLVIAYKIEDMDSWEIFLIPAVLGILMGPALHYGLPMLLNPYAGGVSINNYFLAIWAGGFLVGNFSGYFYFRFAQPKIVLWKDKITKRTELERDKKTDVRTVKSTLPNTPKSFDVMEFYKPGFITLGLNGKNEPVRVSFDIWSRSHIQLAGTTGAGKGVIAQMALTQAIFEGEAVIVLDPKNDEWAPHALAYAANKNGVPYHFIDLRDGTSPQINPLLDASRAELQEMFLAAFSLGEKGGDADFYRLNDRKAARAVAALISEHDSPSFFGMLREISELPEVKAAPGFLGAFEEMAELQSINASSIGVNIADVIQNGGVIYVVGSMRNSPVIKAQRMLMIRLIQICEKRDRLQKQRSVCVFLDELKYHLSKPAMEIFGAARDKGLHAIIAHQAISDLRDVPADLNPDAVVGSVIENTALKIIYRLQDPDTAEWLAKRSGTKLVDEEIRKIGRNVAQSEILDDERTIRQSETYLIDTNMLMNLPRMVAVFFSEELPQFVGTSPIPIKKDEQAISITTTAIDSMEIISNGANEDLIIDEDKNVVSKVQTNMSQTKKNPEFTDTETTTCKNEVDSHKKSVPMDVFKLGLDDE